MTFRLCLFSLFLLLSAPAFAATCGPARVIDADTIVIGTEHVRIVGIDAPEKKQACTNADGVTYLCGITARDALVDKTKGKDVMCDSQGKDRYGRTLGVCYVSGQDLGRWLVEQGLVVAYRQYSSVYVDAEDAAKASKVGLWAGTFDMPADWRKAKR